MSPNHVLASLIAGKALNHLGLCVDTHHDKLRDVILAEIVEFNKIMVTHAIKTNLLNQVGQNYNAESINSCQDKRNPVGGT